MFRRLALVAAAVAAAPALAQSPGSLTALVSRGAAASPAAKEFRELRVEPRQVYEAVGDVVRSLRWHTSLRDAHADAVEARKPIVWIRALGDLKGYT